MKLEQVMQSMDQLSNKVDQKSDELTNTV
jgi:hypothetical protein